MAIMPAGSDSIKEERVSSLIPVSPDEHIFIKEFLQARNLAPHFIPNLKKA